MTKRDHSIALGCLVGACAGDAAGATLEFIGRRPHREEVEQALRMVGGGVWQLAPGQTVRRRFQALAHFGHAGEASTRIWALPL